MSNERKCRVCQVTLPVPTKRGRPPVKCDKCKLAGMVADLAPKKTRKPRVARAPKVAAPTQRRGKQSTHITSATKAQAPVVEHVAGECEVCDHSQEHGWWGPSISTGSTHCKGCHLTWSSKSQAHCLTCHRHFSVGSVADVCHPVDRKGDMHCIDPATVMQAGRRRFELKERNGVQYWSGAGTYTREED